MLATWIVLNASSVDQAIGGVFESQLGESGYDCQDIVEFMGNAAGQGAQGFHFLSLAKLALQVLQFRQVGYRRPAAVDPSVLIFGRGGLNEDVERSALGPVEPELAAEDFPLSSAPPPGGE